MNPAARAQSNYWLNPADGNFTDATSWSSSAAPVYSDDVVFSVGNASYTVSFDANYQTTDSLLVGSDAVTFQFKGDGGLNGSNYFAGATTIGDISGNVGELSLSGIGTLQSQGAVIGDQAGSSGTMNIDIEIFDGNGAWDVNGDLVIGNNGAGTLNLTAGTVTSADVTVGANAGALGTVNMSGGSWSANSLTIGNTSDAVGTDVVTLAGGSFTSYNAVTVNSSAELIVNGGSLNAASLSGGPGSVQFTGGSITLQSDLTLDANSILGPTPSLVSGQSLSVNNLAVSGGTVLSITGGSLNAASLTGDPGSVQFTGGSVTLASDLALDANSVFGPTPSLTSGQSLSVNNLSISGGTVLSMTGGSLTALTIGATGGIDFSSGSVNVTGGDIVIDPVNGTFDSGDISLNAGDSLTASGNLIVGNGGNASLTINNENAYYGTSPASASATNIQIAANGGSASVLVTSEGAALSAANQITVGGNGGTGTITIDNYGNVTAGGTLHINAGSEVDIDGGSLTVNALDAGRNGAGGQVVYKATGYDYGSLTVQTGGVTIGSTGELAGNFTLVTNDYVGLPGGTVLEDQGFTLSGGQFQTGQITRAGSGQIVFNSGILTATGDLGIGAANNAANQIASNVTLDSGSDIETTGAITIGTGGSVTMMGGNLHADTLQVDGMFNYQTGNLNIIHGDVVIDNSSTGQHLFGANPTFASADGGTTIYGSITNYANVYLENVTIGGAGTGSANVYNGGSLDASSRFVLGDSATGNGSLTVGISVIAGGGGIRADQFIVGNYGTGELTLINGDVTVDGLSIAAQPGSSGSVTVNGGIQDVLEMLVVGGTYSDVGGTPVATAGGTGTYTVGTPTFANIPASAYADRLAVFNGSSVVLSGGDLGINYDSTFSAGATLTDSGHTFSSGSINNAGTLEGYGAIGASTTATAYNPSVNTGDITNSGLINANVSGQTLTITTQGTGSTLTNSGTLEASGGGTLNINGLTVNNSGGTIFANQGEITMESGTISGGTLTASSAGTILASGTTENATLNNSGLVEASTGGLTIQDAVVTNSGAITTSTGTTLTLQNSTVTNTGTLAAQGDFSTLDIINSTVNNAGELGAGGNNSTLDIKNSIVNNAGGTITSGTSIVTIDSSIIEGGAIRGIPNAAFMEGTNPELDGYSHGALTIGQAGQQSGVGFVVTGGNAQLIAGTIIDYAGITDFSTPMNIKIGDGTSDSATFTGTGTVEMTQATSTISGYANGNTLTNDTQHTIEGEGTIENLSLINKGTIDADQPSSNLTIQNATTITNTGTLEADGGGTLDLKNVTVNGAGGHLDALGGNIEINASTIAGNLSTSAGAHVTVLNSTANFQTVDNYGSITTTNSIVHTVSYIGESGSTDVSDPSSDTTGSLDLKNNSSYSVEGTTLDVTSLDLESGSKLTINSGGIIRATNVDLDSDITLTLDSGFLYIDTLSFQGAGDVASFLADIDATNGSIIYYNPNDSSGLRGTYDLPGDSFLEPETLAAPEPSTWAMLLLGLGTLFGFWKVRRRVQLS